VALSGLFTKIFGFGKRIIGQNRHRHRHRYRYRQLQRVGKRAAIANPIAIPIPTLQLRWL
jgi:hypothetical protein